MTPETWSLVASGLSIVLALIAIALSVWFFIEANKANQAASVTLAEVKTLAATIQQHAFSMLELTLRRLSPSTTEDLQAAIPGSPELALTKETAATVAESEAGKVIEKSKSPLDQEVEKLNKLYASQMQLANPFVQVLASATGDFVPIERERLRDMIAVQRAKLEREYGVKFDGPVAVRAKKADSN